MRTIIAVKHTHTGFSMPEFYSFSTLGVLKSKCRTPANTTPNVKQRVRLEYGCDGHVNLLPPWHLAAHRLAGSLAEAQEWKNFQKNPTLLCGTRAHVSLARDKRITRRQPSDIQNRNFVSRRAITQLYILSFTNGYDKIHTRPWFPTRPSVERADTIK